MRIISQSKECDFNYEHSNVFMSQRFGKWNINIAVVGMPCAEVIGEYSTKEKALKVMEMIRGKHYTMKTYEINGKDFIELGGFDGGEESVKALSPYFYMPQDSEVDA